MPLELKSVAAFPKRATTPVLGIKSKKGLRLSQRNWWLEWTRHGGKGFIVVEVGGSVYSFPSLLFDAINELDTIQFMALAAFRDIDSLVRQLSRNEG